MKLNFKFEIHLIVVLIATSLMACTRGPSPIEIGKDLCALCKMTIMDKRYGAELITDKGKIYKFDSAECLVNYLKEYPESEHPLQLIMVIDHALPGEFINAKEAFYLHSEKLSSPMGANVTALHSKAIAEDYLAQYGGEIWTWEELCRQVQ
ncbi:MAG TPA: nitrous oxide reductase accessory protein NosL [Bacteroidia bacterium]|nr:nitrous oxide reductase accessory protein NosL [Bacteroidia bacterium]